MLGGLAEAAEQGIVHRDLKPENLLVTADGRVKIADFGIAKAIGQVCMTEFRTATGQVVGTPAYMAPEQVTGGDITPQADLYATGLIAYELLAGRHPFEGIDAPMALLLRQVNDEPPPLAELRPDLPPGVVAWVHAMLAKEPAARPAGAAHAWDRLEGAVSDELGPLWRRGAALVEPGAERVTGVHPSVLAELPSAAAPSELSGIYSVLLPALPPAPAPAPTAADGAARGASGRAAPPRARAARLARRRAARRGRGLHVHLLLRRRSARRAAPAGPSLEERVRQVVAPALRTNARLSRELEALVPGSDPEDALERADAALAATTAAREQRVAPARPALRAQAAYLRVVRSALKLRASEAQLAGLGGVSARLVSRLERLEATVPRASASVGGARKLKRWVLAELAPAPVLPPAVAPHEVPAAVPTPAPAPRRPRHADRDADAHRHAAGRRPAARAAPRGPAGAPADAALPPADAQAACGVGSGSGSTRSSQRGIHQLRSPSSCITAGTSTIRTIVASIRIAAAMPMPISFRNTSGLSAKAPNTATMISAAAVITRAVRASPSVTACEVDRPDRNSSRTRLSRNTS